jgi:hypothetical protein
MTDRTALERVSTGFRGRYLAYDAVASQLRAWADAFPGVCSVRSIGTSVEGRDLLVLTIDRDPTRKRPAAWIDGNMHAQEVCGSSVALAIAEDVLALHLGGTVHGLPEHVAEQLRDVVFHVLPRMCPDGAEAVLHEGRYVRSNPRDRRPHARPRWVAQDLDGDGAALVMRKLDPHGELAVSREVDGLLVPRALEDEGPFYKVYPEGMIEPWDGHTVPTPHFLSDNDTDLNRNFPFSWMPEPEQEGAGAYPASEPESRAVVDFAIAHPEIFSWLNLHTFGGVYIRPLGHQADNKMDPSDLAIFRQIAAWGEEHGGYPTVSGFEEFLYEPDKPLHGDLSDFAYHQRGAIAFVCELWDLFAQVGLPRKKPFVDNYTHLGRLELVKIAKWDAEHNQGRALRPWKAFHHPQLGDVEIGGLDPRVGMVNPSYEKLPEVCTRQSAFFLRVAALAPSVTITTKTAPVGDGATQIEVTIANHGYLPTNVLSSAKKLPWNEPPFLDVAAEGCELIDPASAHQEVGHLAGWGRGAFGTLSAAAFFQRTDGSVSTRVLRFVVTGKGTVRLRVSSPRIGEVVATVSV